MKEKEFFKEQAQQTMKQLLELKDSAAARQKDLENEAQRRKLEVQLLEEKNARMVSQVLSLTKNVEENQREISRL